MCAQIIKDGWYGGQEVAVQEKIRRCSEKLMVWGREITGNFSGRIKECKKELERYKAGRDEVSIERYKDAKRQLDNIYNQREIFWRQRSKQLWLKAGDKNSKYFHKTASQRRRTNRIQKLQNSDGQWVDWENGLPDLISQYFTELFSATESNWHEVVDCVTGTITERQNKELMKPVDEEEVRAALFQMNPDKAPGPDGMTPGFFSEEWEGSR
ncbi:uncharacterized protein LOC141686156 [Apium graveolens]|uniref:uncharacterized protein LOC141686156 n=1 Tax=Apium graveolens TaxID=4045 RepID=UPI003D798D8B